MVGWRQQKITHPGSTKPWNVLGGSLQVYKGVSTAGMVHVDRQEPATLQEDTGTVELHPGYGKNARVVSVGFLVMQLLLNYPCSL